GFCAIVICEERGEATMNMRRLRRLLLVGTGCAALLAAPGLPFSGADLIGLSGSAAAQEAVDVDYFYDALDPYGQWVWHPRFGYVWLPENVSENWRPYTVGHWVDTDEYGWYWDSHEPFAWAVYHYGRWGYDPDYGWFWVPGDTWAPAWVQWRYSDEYVGWAPIGPAYGGGGYAYGVPVSYEAPVAESWVFVQPRYLTSRFIYHYAVPVAQLNVAFLAAPTVYRPEFHGGVVYNFGIPRDRVARITNHPIVVRKVFKVENQSMMMRGGAAGGIKVFAPPVANAKPERMPKRFADSPSEFKPKAKLKETVQGTPPSGLGPSVATVKPIAKEVGAEEFKKHGERPGGAGGPGGPGGPGPGQATIEGGPGKSHPHGPGAPGGPGGPGGPHGAGGPGQAAQQGGPPGGPGQGGKGGKPGKPPVCKENPNLPVCKQ
ncbi:MAG TPA: DUF6600 domain-containing protein, partial [Candidatus Methylomirabilis sp.]|nr:DUF6600 domain-containing protein [Candidatus Methylomirabilis sp.]